MAEQTNKLTQLRRLDTADKTRRVLATLDATIDAGQPLSIAALARRAGVSRRFIYDHPELRAQAADRQAGQTAAGARVTAASLRADLANAKAANHRQNTELQTLRRRLGQILGHDILADIGDAPTSPPDPRIEQLTSNLAQTKEELAHRDEELAAARQINRELIARLNREH